MATRPASNCPSPADTPLDGILLAEELLDLAERAQAYTNAAGVVIALLRGSELLVRTSTGTAPEVGTLIPVSDAVIAECLQRRKAVTCRDTDSDPRVGPVFRDNKTRSLVAIPIPGPKEPRGVMVVISAVPSAFQSTHSAILMTLSDIVGSKLAAREDPPEVEVEVADEPAMPVAIAPETAPAPASAETPISVSTPPADMPPAPAAAPSSSPQPERAAIKPAATAPPASLATPPATLMEAMAAIPQAAAVKTPKPQDPALEPATAALSTTPQAVVVPPVLLKHGPLPLVEEKKLERDPGLLSTSEDPGRFNTPQASHANTLATTRPEAVKSTAKPAAPISATATPVHVTPKPVAKVATTTTPLVPVAATAKLVTPKVTTAMPKASALAAAEAPAAPINTAATPVLSSWEASPQESRLGRFLAPVLAVAAVLVVTAFVVLWIRHPSPTSAAIQIPVQPVATVTQPPNAQAVTPPPVAVAVPAPQQVAKSDTVAKVATAAKLETVANAAGANPQPKPAKTPESQAAPAKHEPARVIEIAAAQPRPKSEADAEMVAPKLALASGDSSVATLSRMTAHVPAPPKSDLVPATLISRTAPIYPPAAKQLGLSGTIEMNVTIAADGSVREIRVISGALQLRSAAVDAVRQWRYNPATLGGKPVESSAQIQVKFTR